MRYRPEAILFVLALVALGPQIHLTQADSSEHSLETELSRILPDLDADEIDELTSEGELSLPYGLEPGSLPSVRFAPAFGPEIMADIVVIDPKIGVEVLFLIDAPAGITGIDTKLLATMQSITTMEGIEYYSASRDRMRTLFYESYVVGDADGNERRPDPRPTVLPETDQIYIYQHDSSFGRNVLELTYTVSQDAIRLRMRNLTRMLYRGIIPAVGPEELGLNLVVYPLGDKVLFYGNSAANPVSLLGMEARVQRSFYNRLVALYQWFLTQTSD